MRDGRAKRIIRTDGEVPAIILSENSLLIGSDRLNPAHFNVLDQAMLTLVSNWGYVIFAGVVILAMLVVTLWLRRVAGGQRNCFSPG